MRCCRRRRAASSPSYLHRNNVRTLTRNRYKHTRSIIMADIITRFLFTHRRWQEVEFSWTLHRRPPRSTQAARPWAHCSRYRCRCQNCDTRDDGVGRKNTVTCIKYLQETMSVWVDQGHHTHTRHTRKDDYACECYIIILLWIDGRTSMFCHNRTQA